jgi:acyl-CoA reductase-like NAD-dependent aldehyde dehydrogenase
MGPLASSSAQSRYLEALGRLATTSAEPLLAPSTLPGGAFVTPSMHQCIRPDDGWRAYIEHEFFGPDIALEVVADSEEALERVRWSPYGLSMSVFTAEESVFEWFVSRAPSGIFNWNRSTNNASGLLPFGGVGRSGNFRPAGSTGALYCAHSIAVLRKAHGVFDADPRFGPLVRAACEE